MYAVCFLIQSLYQARLTGCGLKQVSQKLQIVLY